MLSRQRALQRPSPLSSIERRTVVEYQDLAIQLVLHSLQNFGFGCTHGKSQVCFLPERTKVLTTELRSFTSCTVPESTIPFHQETIKRQDDGNDVQGFFWNQAADRESSLDVIQLVDQSTFHGIIHDRGFSKGKEQLERWASNSCNALIKGPRNGMDAL